MPTTRKVRRVVRKVVKPEKLEEVPMFVEYSGCDLYLEENYIVGTFAFTSLLFYRVARWLMLISIMTVQLLILGVFYHLHIDSDDRAVMNCLNLEDGKLFENINHLDILYSIYAFLGGLGYDFLFSLLFRLWNSKYYINKPLRHKISQFLGFALCLLILIVCAAFVFVISSDMNKNWNSLWWFIWFYSFFWYLAVKPIAIAAARKIYTGLQGV